MPDQRSGIDNGIWLCESCAKLIDSDPSGYPVELLRAWKLVAEQQSRVELHEYVPDSETLGADFVRLEALIPGLLAEMREDLRGNPIGRQFILKRKTWVMGGRMAAFEYYYDDHDQLDEAMVVLQNMGLIYDQTVSNIKRYAMTEALAAYLSGPPSDAR